MENELSKSSGLSAHRQHPRHFQGREYVYPVLSRRSRGISIGVNICPEQVCNFNCLYCQVRRGQGERSAAEGVELKRLERELGEVIKLLQSGELYQDESFAAVPGQLRRLNDIALSGDGEPTAAKEFTDVCRVCARVKEGAGLEAVKLVLITNASLLHKPMVQEGLAVLDDHGGEIWAKLDAGNEAYFRFINQTEIPYSLIVDNITVTARKRPVVIQSLFVRVDGKRVGEKEIADYADRLGEILERGGKISLVQLHTVAREPRDRRVSALSNKELEDIADEIRGRAAVRLEIFGG